MMEQASPIKQDRIQSALARLVHQLSGPSRRTLTYSDMMVSEYADQLEENGLRWLQTIHDESLKMVKLVNGLQQYCQLVSEPIEDERMNLLMSVDTVISHYPDIEFNIQIDENIILVFASKWFRFLLMELCDNSKRFQSKQSLVQVNLSAEKTDQGLRLDFCDNGPGVHDRSLNLLGQMFFQESSFTSETQNHVGIGLACCDYIMASYGGKLVFSHGSETGLSVSCEFPSTCVEFQ